ncbi:FkbM family methyltransferase [Hyphobacterium sp.]|uniref:FkbM family methyltransferase n=1 Tax=Hyphobacterium sp. TaxID=2004662 RepID=UPI0037489EAC
MRRPDKREAIQKFLSLGFPVATVIDVGVQYGTPELIDAFKDRLHVLCEPVEEYHHAIETAYAKRGVSYELDKRAVSDADGEATLALSSIADDGAITHARLNKSAEGGQPARSIETVCLDTLVKVGNYPPPYFLKIDVDGAEELVVAGARAMLPECSGVIIEARVDTIFPRSAGIVEAGLKVFDLVDLCYYNKRLSQLDLFFFNPRYAGKGLELPIQGTFNPEKWFKLT